jgi:hypothetical protein
MNTQTREKAGERKRERKRKRKRDAAGRKKRTNRRVNEG